MKYEKPPLTLDAQVERLLARGMIGDPALMKHRLSSVNYYRLSGYWYPLRKRASVDAPPEDDFKPGTTFDTVWERYTFDRALRLLVMDGIERIEVAVRMLVAYHHAHHHGAFAWAEDATSLPKFNGVGREEFLQWVADDVNDSNEEFVRHFRQKYGSDHQNLPIWMASEIMTFGKVLRLLKHSANKVKNPVASAFEQPYETVESWLLALNTARNLAAHHCRMWNREFGITVRPAPQWDRFLPAKIALNGKANPALRRVFTVLTISNHTLNRICPGHTWAVRLKELIDTNPTIPLKLMGFPERWTEIPLWKNALDASASLPPASVLPPLPPKA